LKASIYSAQKRRLPPDRFVRSRVYKRVGALEEFEGRPNAKTESLPDFPQGSLKSAVPGKLRVTDGGPLAAICNVTQEAGASSWRSDRFIEVVTRGHCIAVRHSAATHSNLVARRDAE